MSNDLTGLWAAYAKTDFDAVTPAGTVRIRVGETNQTLDALLDSHQAGCWAFITAFNPGSRPLSDQENIHRHEQLRGLVSAAGYRWFEGQGVGQGTDWPPERSLLILGITLPEAIYLGRRFGQLAIVAGTRGEAACLQPCGEDADGRSLQSSS